MHRQCSTNQSEMINTGYVNLHALTTLIDIHRRMRYLYLGGAHTITM